MHKVGLRSFLFCSEEQFYYLVERVDFIVSGCKVEMR